MAQITLFESVLKRDRFLIAASLMIMAALSWAYMVYLAWNMRIMDMAEAVPRDVRGMVMTQVMSWSIVDFAMTVVMWVVMMVAMMVPAAVPMVLLFATVNRKRRERQCPFIPTGVFLSGYLLVWWGFAILAALAQWGLHQRALLPSKMDGVPPVFGGVILITAGIFQWTPLKSVCLKHCRTPLDHLVAHWREGRRGALLMGVEHGVFCLGCCWFLMGLMFVAGVMNLVWMAGVAAYILIEKIIPERTWGNIVTWSVGAGMVIWGAWMVLVGQGS
ncbi:MAG: DUF2182 domain-containing protein [Nitrospiria bacterium]